MLGFCEWKNKNEKPTLFEPFPLISQIYSVCFNLISTSVPSVYDVATSFDFD